VAVDPISVKWSGQLRMYSLLEFLSVVLTLLFYQAIVDEPTRRRLVGFVGVFWLAVFTHIAISLFLPPMALIILGFYRSRLLKDRKDVLAAGVFCGIAPIALTLSNRVLCLYSTTNAPVSFVGDHLVDLGRVQRPDFTSWRLLFSTGNLKDVMPYAFVLANGLLIAGYYLWRQGNDDPPRERLGVTTVLMLNWVAIGLVAAFTTGEASRYLIHVQPLGFFAFILGAREFFNAAKGASIRTVRGAALSLGAVALLAAQFLNIGTGLANLTANPQIDTDYVAASLYVNEHRDPNAIILTSVPEPTYLALDGATNLYYLVGRLQVGWYTHALPDGSIVDFWIGAPAVIGARNLCGLLYQHPDSWIVVDKARLNANWGFSGSMNTIIWGAGAVQFTGAQSIYAIKMKPESEWTPAARIACQTALQIAPPADPIAVATSG